jgi:hypothetical protein
VPSPGESGDDLLDAHFERKPSLDFDIPDDAVAQVFEVGEKLDYLSAKSKLPHSEFRARVVIAADLYVAQDPGRWIELRLTAKNVKVLNASEVDPLHQLDEANPGAR